MVAPIGRNPLAMSSVTSPGGRVQGSNFTPHHFKPFSSHEHYQQVSVTWSYTAWVDGVFGV